MWQTGGINEGVGGYKISCTKCAGLENMPGNAAFSPALGAIATAAGLARHTGSTQASKSLDWWALGLHNDRMWGCEHQLSLLDPNNLPLSPREWAGCHCSLSFSRAFCLSILKSPHLQPGPGQHKRQCFSVLSRSGPVASSHLSWAGGLLLRKHCLYKQKRLHPLAYIFFPMCNSYLNVKNCFVAGPFACMFEDAKKLSRFQRLKIILPIIPSCD